MGQKVNPSFYRSKLYNKNKINYNANTLYMFDYNRLVFKINAFYKCFNFISFVADIYLDFIGSNKVIIYLVLFENVMLDKTSFNKKAFKRTSNMHSNVSILENLYKQLYNEFKCNIKIKYLKSPFMSSVFVTKYINHLLKQKLSIRRILKQVCDNVYDSKKILGVKILIKGRLENSERTRSEEINKGKISLFTYNHFIDYTFLQLNTSYGIYGIKVWIIY